MPSVMRLLGRWAGSRTPSSGRRSTAGSGWSSWCRPAAATAAAGRGPRGRRIAAWVVGEVVDAAAIGGAVRGGGQRTVSGRIAVGVSGSGSQPAGAGRPRRERGVLGGEVVLVFADRACPALDWAAEQGIDTVLVPGRRRREPRRRRLAGGRARTSSSWPATCGSSARPCSAAFAGRILNVHPSLLPVVPGPARGPRRARGGRRRDRRDGPPRRRDPRRRADRRPARRSPVLPGDDEDALLDADPRRSSTGSCRAAVAAPAGRRARGRTGRRRDDRLDTAAAEPRCRSRAARSCRSRTRPGWRTSARGLVARGFELVSTGGTARALREAGLPGHGRRRRHRLPGDARRAGEDAPPAGPRRHPRRPPAAPTTARQLARRRRSRPSSSSSSTSTRSRRPPRERPRRARLRRPRRGDRHRRAVDGPGGGQEPRQRGDRHLAGALRRRSSPRSTRTAGSRPGLRSALAVEAFRHTAAYDARIAAELPGRMAAAGVDAPRRARPAAAPPTRTRRPHDLAWRRWRRSATARTPTSPPPATGARPRAAAADGPFASGEPPLQGKAL